MGDILWGRCPGCPPLGQGPGDLLASGFLVMSAVLFPAEAAGGPLLALSLPACVRDSPAFLSGPHSTPPSFSSSSSTDGDLDFQSPGGSQGRPRGKGELGSLRLGVSPGEGREASMPTVLSEPTGADCRARRLEQSGGTGAGADTGLGTGWQCALSSERAGLHLRPLTK